MNLNTEPKRELLVFKKKEVIVVIVLLALVSLFSFTLGVRLGKQLGASHKAVTHDDAHAPLHDAGSEEHSAPKTEAHAVAHADKAHEEKAVEDHATQQEESKATAEHAKSEDSATTGNHDVKTDAILAHELDAAKAGAGKKISMSYPSEKKTEKKIEHGSQKKSEKVMAGKYYLQVGSHQEEKEADDQVSELRRHGLDAFKVPANIPAKGMHYRVGVGIFPTKDMADKAGSNWKRTKNLPPYFLQKFE